MTLTAFLALALALLATAPPAFAGAIISNGTVKLGVNDPGQLNFSDPVTGEHRGVTYVPTDNDGTRQGCECEGWGAGAGGPIQFSGWANDDRGTSGFNQVSFTSTASTANSIVEVLRNESPALRVTHNFRPSPSTPNLYEIAITLENLTTDTLTKVRYERIMDWDVEPTPFQEFVTINRGSTPPADLFYSDDNGFSDNDPFTFAAEGDGPLDPATVNTNYTDKGPDDHGARFTFDFGNLGPGARKDFTLLYGAAGNEADANAAVSAAAVEVFSYGQPSGENDPAAGTPNTFIWGFRGVGGAPIFRPPPDPTPRDTTPPDTPITSGPPASSKDHTPTFTFTSTEPGSRFECSLDGGPFEPCSSPYTTPPLAPGRHTLAVRAIDAAGNADPTPTTYVFEVEPFTVADLPDPVMGETVNVEEVRGTVLVGIRGSAARAARAGGRASQKGVTFVPLSEARQIPVGSFLDTRRGTVKLQSARTRAGKRQTGNFLGTIFQVRQSRKRSAKGLTDLILKGASFRRCATARGTGASAVASRTIRRLRANARGRFRTRGRYSSATVRGTRWDTTDRCDGTLTRVRRGRVVVRDFRRKRNILLTAGKSYLARAPR